MEKDLTAISENDIEYTVNNTPYKYWKSYSKEGIRANLKKNYTIGEVSVVFGEISGLKVQNKKRCNSFNYYYYYYYYATFFVQEAWYAKYLDSTALEFYYQEYGKNNVNFNSNSKILTIVDTKKKVVIFDKDRKWKVLIINDEFLGKNYGEDFSDCLKSSL